MEQENIKLSEDEIIDKVKFVINEIAHTLEWNGWCQHAMHQANVKFDHPDYDPYNHHANLNCPRCPLAAMSVVCLKHIHPLNIKSKDKNKIMQRVYKVIKDNLKMDIHTWNDESNRTAKEVISMFKFIADSIIK